MGFFFRHAALPKNRSLLEAIEIAAERLKQNLQQLSVNDIGISEYSQNYLRGYIKNIQNTLQINCYILAWLLADSKVKIEEYVLIDYGGGCGILSLLAKELGVRTVIYNDIYDVSCHDAKLIGIALHKEADEYVCGDMDDLLRYLYMQHVLTDGIASYDVIEHIYDIEGYFRKLSLLPCRRLSIAFASSANNMNPVINKQRMNAQRKIELYDRERVWGHKERDSLQSYLSLRKRIIASYASSLSSDETEYLANATRGLIKNDIERCVLEYQNTGYTSYRQRHPTNTCDPYTGNWAEHLMDIHWLEEILLGEGFLVEIKNGYYGFSPRLFKRLVKNSLNWLISVLQTKGLLIAPFYMICAQRGYYERAQ